MKFPKIYLSEEILNIVINQLKKDKQLKDNRYLDKYINEFQLAITKRYEDILNKLPDYETLNDYYKLMFQNITPKTTMMKYKNHYSKTIHVINKLSEKYKKLFKKDKQNYKKYKKEYIGRVSSAIKRLNETNKLLMEFETKFKRIANPRFNLFTIVIVGLPNAGKTTFLTEITDANPEINSYEFTTKALNLGYFKIREKVIQVIDTPGLIHTKFNDMNYIEKNAIVAIKSICDVIIFMYNEKLNEKKQEEMYNNLKENNLSKKIFVYTVFGKKPEWGTLINKKDILSCNF